MALTPATCTVEAVTGIVADIKLILSGAIVDVKALAGASAEVILGGGVEVTVDVIAKVVADLCIVSISFVRTEIDTHSLYQLIFGAIGVVLNLGIGATLTVILPILCSLG